MVLYTLSVSIKLSKMIYYIYLRKINKKIQTLCQTQIIMNRFFCHDISFMTQKRGIRSYDNRWNSDSTKMIFLSDWSYPLDMTTIHHLMGAKGW